MAQRRGSGRELVRGLVAAGLVLLLVIFGVRTMVSRMSEREAAALREVESESESAPPPSTDTLTVTPARPPSFAAAPPGSTAAGELPPSSGLVHPGTVDAMAVRSVVHESLAELRFCFEWQLDAHPDLAGRVTMQFTINEDGTVGDASVLEDELHDDTVTTCFSHVMSHMRFAPPEGGSVLVHYPFALAGSPDARRPEGI